MALSPSYTPSIFDGISGLVDGWHTVDCKKDLKDDVCSLMKPTTSSSLPSTTIAHPSTGLALWSVALARHTIEPLIKPASIAMTDLMVTTTTTTTARPTPDPLQPGGDHPLNLLRDPRRRCNPSIEKCPPRESAHGILSKWSAYVAATRAPSNTTSVINRRREKNLDILSRWTAQVPSTRAGQRPTTLPASVHATSLQPKRPQTPTSERAMTPASTTVVWSSIFRDTVSQDMGPKKSSAGEKAPGRIYWDVVGACLAGVAFVAFYFG